MSAINGNVSAQALEALGINLVDKIKEHYKNNNWPPLKPASIRNRNSVERRARGVTKKTQGFIPYTAANSFPLLWTGTLQRSTTYLIKTRKK